MQTATNRGVHKDKFHTVDIWAIQELCFILPNLLIVKVHFSYDNIFSAKGTVDVANKWDSNIVST